MATIGFLHTGEVHVPTFHALCAGRVAELHEVDESLLADARTDGLTPALTARIDARLHALAEAGADVIVCTCSTIGGVAETLPLKVPVLRADRPMAEAAVAAGPRIAMLYTVESTVAPTRALLGEVGATAVRPVPCPGAWAAFEAGDLEGYARLIADACRSAAPTADVIVLAQASMAPAAALVADLPIPVLTSPRTAVDRAVALTG